MFMAVEDNLYVGTSAAEVLHFVSLPADPADESVGPTFIFASRLQPKSTQTQNSSKATSGVQQILPLSAVKKVCILCNDTLTFYSLPELSPALNNNFVSSCSWVGGTDLNNRDTAQDGVQTIMICIKNRIRLVGIRDDPRVVRNIEFPACLASARRENYACVADSNSYSLLDVENQQKINLFPISSLDENAGGGKVEDISPAVELRPSSNSVSGRPTGDPSGDGKFHGRSTSLGTFVAGLGKRQGSPASKNRERLGINNPEPFERSTSPQRTSTPGRSGSTSRSPNRRSIAPEKPLPAPPEQQSFHKATITTTSRLSANLRPHIISPSSSEFLLTTGTTPTEPGVGIFVNLDGDVVRGTLEFSRYPTAVVVDGSGSESEDGMQINRDIHEGHVLAAMSWSGASKNQPFIEIQKWGSNEVEEKGWLDIPTETVSKQDLESNDLNQHGLRAVHTSITIQFPEVGASLKAARLRLPSDRVNHNMASDGKPVLENWEIQRSMEETKFASRLGSRESNIVVWSGSSIWWVVRSPLAMRLDAAIDHALEVVNETKEIKVDRSKLFQIINKIRDQEGTTETEFLSLEYVRQKISLIMFCDLIMQSSLFQLTQSSDLEITEALLIEGNIDPRVVLSMIPLLREEIIEGPRGIWIHSGLIWTIQRFWSAISSSLQTSEERTAHTTTDKMIGVLKRYLLSWRQRKGFGSIADEVEVFKTIDAAILHLLLHYDSLSLSGSSKFSSRAELYSVVDSGVDCFDRAVALLENYKRLYVLSRLYGSRKMAGSVLQTWRRIIDGEGDADDELADGENEVRRYLVKIRDPSLFHEYGTWLARRNPALGVQVYTDDNSKVRLPPHQVVEVLQNRAPEAVKVYLEHLVFGKKNFQYANDLISYYLDNVLSVLGASKEAQEILSQSYETYRALQPPKPTYRQFVIDNAVPVPWWHDRLRLLELLGGSHGADFSYDVASILSRIEPFEQDLVPESIILDGRQGRHQQALRLLIHGLGDYHTAINYCLLGGASIFYPTSGPVSSVAAPNNEEQAGLFGHLLEEFLHIEDINNRLERTSELLERFGSWYEVSEVLGLIPESWSVDNISGFLINSFRRLVQEKNEAMITKALSGAENLQIASSFIEKCSALGPQIEGVQ